MWVMATRTVEPYVLSGQRVEKMAIEIPDSSTAPLARCYVYEVWDRMNRLVYVGIADHFERRWAQHRRSSFWLGEITVAMVRVEGYRSREDARLVEACTINDQSAVYNTDREDRAYARYNAREDEEAWRDDPWGCTPVDRIIYKWVH